MRPAPEPDGDEGPSAAVADSSSVRASAVAGPRGFDGAKKVDGVKRHILIYSAGMLAAAAGVSVSVDIVSSPKPANGFQVQPRR